MKVEVGQKENKFQPIELHITIESQEELDSLIAKLAISAGDVNKMLNTDSAYKTKERAGAFVTDMLLQKLELLKG